MRSLIMKVVRQDDLNFVLTNALPRRAVTRFMGWFSRLENPLVCAMSLRVWRFFADVDLTDAAETRFRSMRHCFTRTLRPGARPVAPEADIVTSPCDAIVGASGLVQGDTVLQVKGRPYALADLLGGAAIAAPYRDGVYVTLRLTAGMYHRFHAPHDCVVHAVTHIPGDAWNVNPVTLRKVDRVFCRNERAVIETTLAEGGHRLALVPVAAILVAGIRLGFMPTPFVKTSRERLACHVALQKGEEMGWFEHGSTIIVLAPAGFALCENATSGTTIRVGRPLLRLPVSHVASGRRRAELC